MEHDRSKLDYVDQPEQIWVLARVGDGDAIHEAHSTKSGAEAAEEHGWQPWGVEVVETTLHRPSLRAVYGGPTLIEALWGEMDRLMEALMTGVEGDEDFCTNKAHTDGAGPCDHPDSGDKYRAQELAWVLAIVTNAYDPSVDRIREEAMRRWKAAEAEADAQEEALDPDEPMEPGGMMGDGIK